MFLQNVYFVWMHIGLIYVNDMCYVLYSGIHFLTQAYAFKSIQVVTWHRVCSFTFCGVNPPYVLPGEGGLRASPQIVLQWTFSPMAPLGLMWRCLWDASPWVKFLGHRVCGYIIQQSSVWLHQHGCTHHHPPTQNSRFLFPPHLCHTWHYPPV